MVQLGKNALDDPSIFIRTGLQSAESSVSFNSIAPGVHAAGSAITDATQLQADHTQVGTVTNGQGVLLKDGVPGTIRSVINLGAATLKVYPPDAAGIINAKTAGAAVSLTTAQMATFIKVNALHWSAFTATQSA